MQILCVSESATTDGLFSWVDFANSSGRLDVLARCAQVVLSDPLFHKVFSGMFLVFFTPQKPMILKIRMKLQENAPIPSEFDLALDLKNLFKAAHKEERAKGKYFELVSKNIKLFFTQTLFDIETLGTQSRMPFLLLDETGEPLENYKGDLKSSVVMIGDQRGCSTDLIRFLEPYKPRRISLGKKSYLASQSLFYVLSEALNRTSNKLEHVTKTQRS